MTEHSLHALAMQIRYDLTAAQGKLTELTRQIGELPIDTSVAAVRCPHCDIEVKGQITLAEHLYNQHDGPVPAHYQSIEARAVEPPEHDDEPDIGPSVST